MTFPWSNLGIEPTENTRDIKKAYAQRLKSTRPDEHPEAFKTLHDAYKRALQLAELGDAPEDDWDWDTLDGGDEVPQLGQEADRQTLELDTEGAEGPVRTVDAHDSGNGQPAAVTAQKEKPAIDEAAATKLMEETKALLSTNPDLHQLAKWRFIEEEPQMLDESFRAEVGDRLLAHIIKHQAAQMKLRGDQWHLKVGEPILAYLNRQFGWSYRYYDLLNKFDYDEIDFLRDLPAAPPQPKTEAFGIKGGNKLHKRKPRDPHRPQSGPTYPFMRLAAMAIDLAIIAVPMIVIAKLSGLKTEAEHTEVAFIVYLALAPAFEASRWRATIGKRIMGLQTLTSKLMQMSFFDACWRSLVLAGCIWGLQWLNDQWGNPVSDFAAVIWPFIICSWIAGGRYPHDLLSFTVVLNRGRTR
ncbi:MULTISPECIES: RDD family protein [Kordiimonas]|jgi:uncharacterized RDD family membrane protein YckC|uniref:RDD family protein n=1 Tax=Kordiimonas TaxID=288021 RepID=UPI00257DED70|nr:RDD family protein [Kordiimonas sp. UBA4487]